MKMKEPIYILSLLNTTDPDNDENAIDFRLSNLQEEI